MRRRERGASLLIPALLLITVAAFAALVAARQSGGDIQGTDAQADAVEALMLAETGLERALGRFLGGSACSAGGLGESLSDLSSLGLGSGRTITVSAGADSDEDFAGGALPATQCRVQVTARIARSNVARTVQAILDRSDNFIGTALVAGFDDPAGAAAPVSWSGGAYDYTGGLPTAAANPPSCTRAAYVVKARNGGGSAETAGSAPVSFTTNRPVTLLASFDYRILRVGNGSSACTIDSGGGACPGAADPSSPEGGGGDGEICFTLRDTGGITYDSTRAEVDTSASIGDSVSAPACTPTSQQTPVDPDHQPCGLRYNYSGGTGAGAFTNRATVRFTLGGSGTMSFDRVGFKLYLSGNQSYEMWIDNVILQPSTGAVAGVAEWRDCSATACPAV